MQAFAAPAALGASTRTAPSATSVFGSRVSAVRPPGRTPATTTMAVQKSTAAAADAYMARSAAASFKAAAVPAGLYTVQCTEGTGLPFSAYDTAVRAKTAAFRRRQAGSDARARTADLFATRRAAIVSAGGSHNAEARAVAFPGAASASVVGRAEALRACSRYTVGNGAVDTYMARQVEMTYKAIGLASSGGIYGKTCCDGASGTEADDSRVNAEAAKFRAAQLSAGMQAQGRYNAIAQATALSRGCGYEESSYEAFPSVAGMMRYSSGVYASYSAGAIGSGVGGGTVGSLAVRLSGPNAKALWPSSEVRAAVKSAKPGPFWKAPSGVKDYSYMSGAAVAYGVAAQTGAFKTGAVNTAWKSGWAPRSSTSKW
jgi:hypothetical protein